ncbi:MAG: hypothetical protein O3B68_08015, partial [Planctomycetota bacterium]|nr:hypothetical protein [Planctomycetota bacterium]
NHPVLESFRPPEMLSGNSPLLMTPAHLAERDGHFRNVSEIAFRLETVGCDSPATGFMNRFSGSYFGTIPDV